MSNDLQARLHSENAGLKVSTKHPKNTLYINIHFADPTKTNVINNEFINFFPNMKQIDINSNVIRLTITNNYIKKTKEFAVTQTIKTIREHINAISVTKPSITRRNNNNIVMQLPSLKSDDVNH